ncbi:P-loop containing nucleoside triphosphate hydrolase [Sesbania bispinosa]|nr:P-loop containing nucleoside triphosphate hydrolase [Sesbania bispinosa]
MDIVYAIAAKLAEFTVAPVVRQLGYPILYKSNVEKLKKEVQKLEDSINEVQHSVDAANRNGEDIEDGVQRWLTKGENIVADAKRFHDNEGHAKVGCSNCSFPNLWLRHKLSRKATKMAQGVSEMIAEGKFERISYRSYTQMSITPFARGYEALDSRTYMLNEIKQALKDPNFYMIGICGMGGVGKTTLVKELAWQADKDGSFGVVVMATITDSSDERRIQGQLADGLGLKFEEETEGGRAGRLRQRISKEKSILVILDNIWSKLDLTEVGIPFGDVHKGCKLLLTSRYLNVLNCEMGTQKDFRLDVLSEEESWYLFEKTVGDAVKDYNIKPIAIKVARCCAGLPLLIVTVAKALSKKDVYAWKDSIIQLERFDHEGLHKKVYSTLELSYNYLENNELKSVFLFIGSFGLDYIHTGELFSCYWGLGLCRHAHTLIEAKNRYYKLINDLKDSSLLLEFESEWVRMHDVVRDVAKSIAYRTQPAYAVQRFTEIKKWPEIDQLQKCHSIILPWSYIYELPEMLECPELKLLLLHTVGEHLKVPDNFFSGMREVKVLDLYGMMFSPSPPPSLRLLTNLRSLSLAGCVLEDISIVVELRSLEILSLERSDIKELPKEIGQLAHLRMLNLTNCSGLRNIPANLISSLTCLEELYMGNCFIQWDVKGRNDQSENASLDELRNLSQLTTLDIMIQDASVLPRDMQIFEKLERYNIFIGDMWKWSLLWSGGASESSRTLKFTESKGTSILLDHGFNFLLNSVEDLCLAGLQCIRHVLYELNKEGFPQLKHLCIQYSAELKYIINSVGWLHPYTAFPNLETLVLQNLFNLEEICHGPIPIRSFTNLKSIEVKGCDKLKNLLWYSLVRDLPQLLEIQISDCKLMTEIIAPQTPEADKEIDKIVFPKLHSLTLECLPSLVSFCSLPLTTDTRFTKCVEKNDDSQSIPVALMDQKVGMPHLETLKLSKINSWKLWDDNLQGHSCIQNLTSLKIDKCGNIAYIFSSLVARELVNLQYLEISNCQMLKEIFVFDGKSGNLPSAHEPLSNKDVRTVFNSVIFPNLETLIISHMDQLESNLETMIVTNCPVLEVVFEIQGLKSGIDSQAELQMQLRNLTLEHLPMLKNIWSKNPYGSLRFENLCQLKVTECKILNQVFPLSVAKELQHLQMLHIEKCGVENIVAHDEMDDTAPILVFPELTSLNFRSLTQLRSFYQGLLTLDCPVLRDLDVHHCDQLALFTPKSLNYQGNVPSDPQPLLSFEKVIPNIRELILSSKDVSMLCNGQLNDELIYTVKALRLRCFHVESDKFPSGFLQRFINLESLKVTCSSFIEIFSSESFGRGPFETTMKLRSLILAQLNNLKFICKDQSEMQSILQNLESLKVYRCSSLKIILPSWMLFQNLEELWVQGCAGLENIITPAAATSLLNLRKLCILDCEKIEEIVASDDESNASELAFIKLKHLQFRNLPRLRRFCKGSYSFKFPLLEKLFVINCHIMETFSYGAISAPKLREVYVKPQKEWHWNGDLNTTIRKVFTETNFQDD